MSEKPDGRSRPVRGHGGIRPGRCRRRALPGGLSFLRALETAAARGSRRPPAASSPPEGRGGAAPFSRRPAGTRRPSSAFLAGGEASRCGRSPAKVGAEAAGSLPRSMEAGAVVVVVVSARSQPSPLSVSRAGRRAQERHADGSRRPGRSARSVERNSPAVR